MPPSARRSPLRLVPHESRCPCPASALLCLAFISFCCTVHPRAGPAAGAGTSPLAPCVASPSSPRLGPYDAPFGTCTPVAARSASGRRGGLAKGAMLATTNDSAMRTELQKTREELHRTQIMLMQVCFSLCRLAATQDLAHAFWTITHRRVCLVLTVRLIGPRCARTRAGFSGVLETHQIPYNLAALRTAMGAVKMMREWDEAHNGGHGRRRLDTACASHQRLREWRLRRWWRWQQQLRRSIGARAPSLPGRPTQRGERAAGAGAAAGDGGALHEWRECRRRGALAAGARAGAAGGAAGRSAACPAVRRRGGSAPER